VECGNHYARALASWSLLLALSGFRYSAPEKTLGFDPRVESAKFTAFWSVGEPGYGLYDQERTGTSFTASVRLIEGSGIEIEKLSLASLTARSRVAVEVGGRPVPASLQAFERKSVVSLAEPVKLRAGAVMRVSIQ
jgi:hypothetical protein